MKTSIITASFNCAQTIEDCIQSIINQTYPDIEHIVIDGGSKDGTLEVINKYRDKIAKLVSEPDKGIYDAMNKGLRYTTGDIVGILNSDDVYADEYVLENVVKAMSENNVDTCYGDIVYVERDNMEKVVRDWKGGEFNKQNFRKGWMPPHPTFFVRKEIYQKYGVFNTDFPIAADYELMLRFLYKHNISTVYIPRLLVKMRTGGKSKPELNRIAKNMLENYRAWKVNGLEPNLLTFIMKPLSKATQYMKGK
ncbi:MAG: glycosyltransferase [Nitrospirae bacterium]|nr:glycosyltransferase [Nitrospirota bacterium]